MPVNGPAICLVKMNEWPELRRDLDSPDDCFWGLVAEGRVAALAHTRTLATKIGLPDG